MLSTLGYIQFPSHRVHISRDLDRDRIYCFKSTNSRCDMASFDSEELAADYILEPFPTVVCELVLKDQES